MIIPRESFFLQNEQYNTYCLKNIALLLYSEHINTWEMGCFEDFGQNVEFMDSYTLVINRYLSWALEEWGCLTLRGHLALNGDGAYLNSLNKEKRGVIFIDTHRKELRIKKEVHFLSLGFKFFKVNRGLQVIKRQMNKEELVGHLLLSVFDLPTYSLSKDVQKNIREMALCYDGYYLLQESVSISA